MESPSETVSKPRVFLTSEWRHLLMLSYVVDPDALARFVPLGTELDLEDGHAYVSLVGFMFLRSRVYGCPIPFHSRFEEVNLRFYVRRRDRGEWRRGVVFIKEIVRRRAVAAVARWVYGEPYVTRPMSHDMKVAGESLVTGSIVSYRWRQGKNEAAISARVAGPPTHIDPTSHEGFIAERYWGYTVLGQRTAEYEVEHPPWRVQAVSDARLDGDVAAVYGDTVSRWIAREPDSAFVAEGSPVAVRRGRYLEVGS